MNFRAKRGTHAERGSAAPYQPVAWHDSRWNGHICGAPSANAFCMLLDEVRKNRQDELEDTFAGCKLD